MSSLFERLTMPHSMRRDRSRHAAPGQRIEEIKRHLETLLNTRQGCSQSSPELGLRDFNGHDLGSGDLLKHISSDIRRTIQRFEPRIEVHALKALPDANTPLELHLRLECRMRVENHIEQLEIELLVNSHNRYTRVR
ncbi:MULTISPECIES: type VI secretion system baseplate subunit TssE [unclassified Pseudomonas]|uniref:type VI secretion system baseplate subunit TssE n=1 Tax=unclassified Pseudomonas TaxID=196821 RepID=UPI0035BFAF5E